MTDSIGVPIEFGDWVAFPVAVGGTGLLRYGRIIGFGTSKRERHNPSTIRVEAACRQFEGDDFESLDRAYSVDPSRCIRMAFVPAKLAEVLV